MPDSELSEQIDARVLEERSSNLPAASARSSVKRWWQAGNLRRQLRKTLLRRWTFSVLRAFCGFCVFRETGPNNSGGHSETPGSYSLANVIAVVNSLKGSKCSHSGLNAAGSDRLEARPWTGCHRRVGCRVVCRFQEVFAQTTLDGGDFGRPAQPCTPTSRPASQPRHKCRMCHEGAGPRPCPTRSSRVPQEEGQRIVQAFALKFGKSIQHSSHRFDRLGQERSAARSASEYHTANAQTKEDPHALLGKGP